MLLRCLMQSNRLYFICMLLQPKHNSMCSKLDLGAEYVRRFAKKTDAEEPATKDASDGTGSDGFLSSSDDEEDDLPASGGGGGMT